MAVADAQVGQPPKGLHAMDPSILFLALRVLLALSLYAFLGVMLRFLIKDLGANDPAQAVSAMAGSQKEQELQPEGKAEAGAEGEGTESLAD